MSAHFPPTVGICAASSTTTDDRDGLAHLRAEIAALKAENKRLRQTLVTERAAVPSASHSPEANAAQATLLQVLGSVFVIGIFRTDATGFFTQADSNLQRMFGLTLPAFANLGWLAVVHPEDRQRVQNRWLEMVVQPHAQSMETRLQHPDGQIRHVLLRNAPLLNAVGCLQGHLGFVQDITELRELEAETRLKEELNRQIIASSPDCTKVLDLQGRVLQMSDQGCHLMQVNNFEDVRNGVWSAWWPDEGALLANAAWEGAARGEITRFVGFCPTLQGTPKWWDTVVSPICNAAGETVMLLAVSRDISELHCQQEEIQAFNASLEARVAQRTQELALANQRLRETLDDAHLLYNQAPCGYHSINGDGLFVRINQTELNWLGYQREEVIGGLHFRDLVLPDYLDSVEQCLKQLKLGQSLDPVEVCLRRRDGGTLHALLSSTSVFDAQGHFLHANNTLVDISTRRNAERALSAQRAFLQTVTDVVPVQLAFYDRYLICQFANASYARWLNVPPQSLVGVHLSQVARPENLVYAKDHLTAALAGENQRFEGPRTFPDGTSFYASIEYTPYRVEGEVQGIVVQIIDISQRKAAEDRLRDINSQLNTALERAQNLYNQAPCGYHSLDADGVYVSINDTELQWLGHQRHEVVGKKNCLDFVSARHADTVQSRLQQLIALDQPELTEYEMYRRDGTPFHALVSSSAVRDASGRFLHTNTTVVDITGRKTAELALRSNQRFIQAITDHVPGVMTYLDTDLRFRFANAYHLTLFGMDPKTILGKPLSG